jgi:hypothetical protein
VDFGFTAGRMAVILPPPGENRAAQDSMSKKSGMFRLRLPNAATILDSTAGDRRTMGLRNASRARRQHTDVREDSLWKSR